MPTSEKQIAANQQNAQHSTGPRTPEGKAISSLNALKHGLFARDIILDSPYHKENAAQFSVLMDSLWEELEPQTHFQEFLVRKIAMCLWRSHRAVLAETSHINHHLADIESDVERDLNHKTFLAKLAHHRRPKTTPEEVEASINFRVGQHLVPARSFSHNILWYEMRLDRQIMRAYELLGRLQQRAAKVSANRRQRADDQNIF